MLKDHLGNVRMVLTEEAPPAAVYQATIEDANRVTEEALFSNIPQTESAKPNGFDSDNGNQKVTKLYNITGADKRVGPGVVLKVMAGDKFNALVNAWYEYGNTEYATLPNAGTVLNMIMSSITGGMPASGVHTGSQVSSAGVLNVPVGDILDYR